MYVYVNDHKHIYISMCKKENIRLKNMKITII